MVNVRRPHYLTLNYSTQKPTRHIFFDVETYAKSYDDKIKEQKVRLGYALYWRRRPERSDDTLLWSYFTDIDVFWHFVLSHVNDKETLYLVSHNITFDFMVCDGFNYLKLAGFELTSIYTKGMTVIIKMKKGKSKIVILNNTNWFQCKLETLGEAVGLKKLKVDFSEVSDEDLKVYCKRDVEILYKAWQTWYKFLDTHNLGCWSTTLPGQAFNAFRHRFMKHKLLVHCHEKALKLERSSYHGGRSSVYFCGSLTNQKFYKLDINSAYPFAMMNTEVPIKFLFYTERITLQYLLDHLSSHAIIADVELDCDENPFPVISDGHIVYPIKRFRTVLTTPELIYAAKRNWIKHVYCAAFYQKAIIFKEYVEYFYKLKEQYRKDNNVAFYYLTKLLLNSLYGKFGQTVSNFTPFCEVCEELKDVKAIIDTKTGKPINLYQFGDTLWKEEKGSETSESIPGIAAHITANTRLYLHNLRLIAGIKHCYYSDTDSLIVDETGLKNLEPYLSQEKIGGLKIEAYAESVEIKAPKTYRFGDDWKRKGIPASSEHVAENTWQFDMFPSLRTLARKPLKIPYWTRRTLRTLTYKVYDGIVTETGWIVPLQNI